MHNPVRQFSKSEAFDSFSKMLEYKAAERSITVERVDEHNTSKSCASRDHG